MQLDQNLVNELTQQANAIAEKDVKDPPMPASVYQAEFGSDLAEMEQDKQLWTGAGFDWTLFIRWYTLAKVLFDAVTGVVLNRKTMKKALAEWKGVRGKVKTERERLLAVCDMACAGNPAEQATLSEIREGNSNMDQVQDILSLSSLALEKLSSISHITIGGVQISEAYLLEMQSWARQLQDMIFAADAAMNNRQKEILFRNRLIMLCLKAEEEMNRWLPIVYFEKPERIGDYASDYHRKTRSTTPSVSEEIDEMTSTQSASSVSEDSEVED